MPKYELSQEVFGPGHGLRAMNEMFKLINRKSSVQATAATATLGTWVADYSGHIQEAQAVLGVLPASGESMVIDIRKNGSTILTGTLTVNSSTTSKYTDMTSLISAALASFVPGDIFTVVRTYTAGGGPAMTYSEVTIFPAVHKPLRGRLIIEHRRFPWTSIEASSRTRRKAEPSGRASPRTTPWTTLRPPFRPSRPGSQRRPKGHRCPG